MTTSLTPNKGEFKASLSLLSRSWVFKHCESKMDKCYGSSLARFPDVRCRSRTVKSSVDIMMYLINFNAMKQQSYFV